MTYDDIEQAAQQEGLILMGTCTEEARTLVLLGAGRGFWPAFSASSEKTDARPDPLDRWSTRVVTDLASRFQADAVFPFGGPPYAPFIPWAKATGRTFNSPVGMLVHDTVGMMISFRGALHLPHLIDCPPPPLAQSPCMSCEDKPCLSTCPVDALSDAHAYDVPACRTYLGSSEGARCMTKGCAVRRACPLSAGAARSNTQSAFHMKAFYPT